MIKSLKYQSFKSRETKPISEDQQSILEGAVNSGPENLKDLKQASFKKSLELGTVFGKTEDYHFIPTGLSNEISGLNSEPPPLTDSLINGDRVKNIFIPNIKNRLVFVDGIYDSELSTLPNSGLEIKTFDGRPKPNTDSQGIIIRDCF